MCYNTNGDTMTKTYKIAEKTIEIRSVYENVHKLCADYTADGTPDFCIETTDADITAELSSELSRSPSYLETLAVYRKISEAILEFDTFLMHGSVMAVDGQAYMFTAPSGTGKSTHSRLWRELLGDRAVMVNDDKPLLRVTDSGVIAYGTPWNGKHHLGSNIGVPLKAVAILHRSEQNSVVSAERTRVYPVMMQQIYRPADPIKMVKTVQLFDKVLDNVALFELYCNMEPEAAEISYRALKGTDK